MVTGGDGPSDSFVPSDRPQLSERRCALDRWLVLPHLGEDFILSTVAGKIPFDLSLRSIRGPMRSITFNDIKLYERRRCPAVYRKVSVAVWLKRAAVLDFPGMALAI